MFLGFLLRYEKAEKRKVFKRERLVKSDTDMKTGHIRASIGHSLRVWEKWRIFTAKRLLLGGFHMRLGETGNAADQYI